MSQQTPNHSIISRISLEVCTYFLVCKFGFDELVQLDEQSVLLHKDLAENARQLVLPNLGQSANVNRELPQLKFG